MKHWSTILIPLIIIDYVVIRYWLLIDDPEPSVAIYAIVFIAIGVMINLGIALLFYFSKKIWLSKPFVLNAIISGIMINVFWSRGTERFLADRFESWEFEISEVQYRVTRQKENNEFHMSESHNPGSSTTFMYGTYSKLSNKWVLISETHEMIITENTNLIGFPNKTDTIQLTNVY